MSLPMIYNNIKEHIFILRLRELKHRYTYINKNFRQRQAMERFRKSTMKKPAAQIRHEIDVCKSYWGCFPTHYYREDLYRTDMPLSDEQLINFVPEFFFYDLFLPYYQNPYFAPLLSDKIVTEEVFRSVNISQPCSLCKCVHGNLYSNEFENLQDADFNRILNNQTCSKIFVKPVDGQGGKGILIFKQKVAGEYMHGTTLLSAAVLRSLCNERAYIVQQGLIQDPAISSVYPHSINTLRITTENLHGDTRILHSNIRMGRNLSEVDNTSQNGIELNINTTTGIFGTYAYSEEGEKFDRHPDTGYIFSGHTIPIWKNVCKFVLQAAEKIPQIPFIGWDIALTADGICAVEANMGFGLDPQAPIGGFREALRIDNPMFYWKNRGKRSTTHQL